MTDYRARRKRAAEAHVRTPGLELTYQVDGRLQKKARNRVQSQKEDHPKDLGFRAAIIGDVGFADGTAIVGFDSEMQAARPLLTKL